MIYCYRWNTLTLDSRIHIKIVLHMPETQWNTDRSNYASWELFFTFDGLSIIEYSTFEYFFHLQQIIYVNTNMPYCKSLDI